MIYQQLTKVNLNPIYKKIFYYLVFKNVIFFENLTSCKFLNKYHLLFLKKKYLKNLNKFKYP